MTRLATLTLITAAFGCAPPAGQETAAPPDSAAVRSALEGLGDQYEAAETAHDPAAIAALFTDDATVAFYGAPTAAGRAAIEQLHRASPVQVNAMHIETRAIHVATGEHASAMGVAHQEVDSAGTVTDRWYRWAATYRKVGPHWRLTYLMAFPDSVKAK